MCREESKDQVESSARPCSVTSDSGVDCLQFNKKKSMVLKYNSTLFHLEAINFDGFNII